MAFGQSATRTSKELQAICERLRTSDSSVQHVWVALAALIFLRWADFQDAEREAIAAFDEDDFTPVLPSRLHWRSWCELPPEQLSETLKSVMGRIVDHEPDAALAVQLSRITPGLEVLLWYPPDVVKSMCQWLRTHPIETPAERLALRRAFDECSASADVEDAGMLRTPDEVVNVMVRLADPKFGESVYDPCLGTGRFLTRSLDHVHKMTDMSDPLRLMSGKPLLNVAGVELDEHQYVIALTRMVLSGVVEPQLERGSSLERDGAGNQHHELFDIVLGNPPWGMKLSTDGLGQYPVPTNDSASLFVQHALSNLRPGGRLMMTVPPSLLFSQKDQQLREYLIERNQLESVISLPSKLFKPYTSVGFTLLEVVRGGQTKSVRFVDGDAIYRENREDLEKSYTVDELCIKFWNHARRPESETTYRVEGVSKLADREYDLTPRARTESKLEANLELLDKDIAIQTLGEVCKILRGHNIPGRELMGQPPRSNYEPSGTTLFDDLEQQDINPQRPFDFADQAIPYLRIKDIQGGTISTGSSWLMPAAASNLDPKKKVRGGDVLLSKSGSIGKAGIVRNGAIGGVASSGLFILRTQPGIDANYLVAYLQSEDARTWLDERARGSAARHLSAKTLESLPIPVPAMQIQERVLKAVRAGSDDVLAELSQPVGDNFDPIDHAIEDWLDQEEHRLYRHKTAADVILERLEYEGDAKANQQVLREAVKILLACLDESTRFGAPLRVCSECHQPYHLNYDLTDFSAANDYGSKILEWCPECWHGVGPSSLTRESLFEASPFAAWALEMFESVDGFRNIEELKDGASLFATLQAGRRRIEKSEQFFPEHRDAERAEELIEQFVKLIDLTLSSLLDAPVVECKAIPLQEPVGDCKFELVVRNDGMLPLRNVEFLQKEHGEYGFNDFATTGLLREAAEVRFPFWSKQPEQVSMRWECARLDGKGCHGTCEVDLPRSIDVGKQSEIAKPLGSSPYVCGDEINLARTHLFYGRSELIGRIRRQVEESGNVVLLEGNRRSGKSSVLRHLEGTETIPNWLCVYCSIQSAEGNDEGRVSASNYFRRFALQIARAVRDNFGSVSFPDGTTATTRKAVSQSSREAIGNEMPFSDFQDFMETVLEQLSDPGVNLLLMLDEFDKLQDDIKEGQLSSQFLLNLRSLIQSTSRFTMLITGSLRLQRLREEYWSALYGLGTRFGVSALSDQDARRLIVEPVRDALTFTEESLNRIIHLTSAQPYLIQCVCNRVFDVAVRTQVTHIKADHLFDAVMELIEDNEHFAALWDYAHLARRKLLLAIIHRESKQGGGPPRFGMLQEKLADAGVFLPDEDLDRDTADLLELELIKAKGSPSDRKYQLAVPLMGLWIELHQDIAVLKSRALAEAEEKPTDAKIRELKHLSHEVQRLEDDLEDPE